MQKYNNYLINQTCFNIFFKQFIYLIKIYDNPYCYVSFTTRYMNFLNKTLFFFFYLFLGTILLCNAQTNSLELYIEINETVPEEVSQKITNPSVFNDYNSILEHLEQIVSSTQEQGYLNSRIVAVENLETNKIKAILYIGEKTNEITVTFNKDDFSKKEISTISIQVTDSSFTIPISKVEKSILILQQLKTEKGDPFASLQLTEFEKKKEGLAARLLLETQNKRIIDSIIIKGYEKLPVSFVKYYAGLKKGIIFSEKKIKEKNTILNSLFFLNSIKPPEVLFKKEKTQVYLYFEKRKNNTFDGILGFNTNEETNNLEFNGYLDLKLNNNLNYGEQLSLYYKADGRQQLNFQIAAKLPYLFRTPLGLDGSLGIFRRDSTFVNTTLKTQITYQARPSTKTSIGYENNVSTNLRNENLTNDVVDFSSNFVTSGVEYTKIQESSLFPIKALFQLEIGIGARSTTNTVENQYKLKAAGHYIFNFNSKNSLYVYNESGLLSSDTFFENELYRFGGITNIRGFNENSIDASVFSILATEYRYLLSPNLYVNSIIDLGYFENDVQIVDDNLYSFGLGLGLQTKTGLLKFALANGTINQNNFSFQNTKIHISLVSNF